MIKYPLKPKVGDIVKCIESEEDEDFGMPRIVFKGNNKIIKGEIYRITDIPWDSDRNVPSNDKKFWKPKEFEIIRWAWHLVYVESINPVLKGSHRVFLQSAQKAQPSLVVGMNELFIQRY